MCVTMYKVLVESAGACPRYEVLCLFVCCARARECRCVSFGYMIALGVHYEEDHQQQTYQDTNTKCVSVYTHTDYRHHTPYNRHTDTHTHTRTRTEKGAHKQAHTNKVKAVKPSSGSCFFQKRTQQPCCCCCLCGCCCCC